MGKYKNKWVLRYLTSTDFWFRKTVLHHKIIKKTRSTKNQENSVYRFGDNHFTNHLVKLNPEEMELIESALVTTFFLRKSLVKAFQPPLTSRVVYLNR